MRTIDSSSTKRFRLRVLELLWLLAAISSVSVAIADEATRADEPVKIAVFDVDATPPLGSAMAYQPEIGRAHV